MPLLQPPPFSWNPSQSNVITPPSGLQTTGYLPAEVPNAQHHNWIFNIVGLWINYFLQQISVTQVSVSSSYIVVAGVRTVLADPTGGAFPVFLQSAAAMGAGGRITVKNIGIGSTNNVSLTPNGTDDIEDTNAVFPLSQGDYITLESDGVSKLWQVG